MHPAAIGPFQVVRELGRGGMGEVFLALDPRLERQVAIKALPAHLAQDSDRLARFQREAKVLASLNHPGIGAIYGLEEVQGHQYLILEFVEGETLADRLAKGPIPIDEALVFARQIAEALEVAHEKGVIHRDLKPGNVMVTPEGLVKVLDFGLARTEDGPSPSVLAQGLADSPTVTSPARLHSPTIPGVIMGTAGYMSPEQARGKPVDKRSDIFSFGCVLYEMLTGAQPFRGESVADSIGATLHKESDLALLPPATPPRVRDLLTNCLAKDRKNRLHDIGDARLELERAIGGMEWMVRRSGERASGPATLRWSVAAAAGVALVGAGWLVGRSLQRPTAVPPTQTFHVSTAVPAKPEFNYVVGIAPDARFVIYKAWPERGADSNAPGGVLVVRRLDRNETKSLDGTEGIMDAALSADGRWLAFAAAKDAAQSKVTLKKMALDDGRPMGSPESLCELPAGGSFSLCWSSDREIIVATVWQQLILAVSASGGEPRVVLKEEQSKEVDNWGDLRPLVPGKSILASRWALVGQTIKERTEIVDLATGKRSPLMPNAGGTQLVAGGYLVTRRNQNALVAFKFDPNTSQPVGEPVTVWNGAATSGPFFVSQSGTFAMTTNPPDIAGRRLMWLDEQGQPQPVGLPPRAYAALQVSPDGGRVVTSVESIDGDLPTDLWIQDLSRRTFSKLPTKGPCWEFLWSNDGQRIAYGNVTADEFAIWERRADGSGEATKMYASPGVQAVVAPSAWSPDGKILAIVQVNLATGSGDVLMLEQSAGGATWKATPYLDSPADEHALRFSPDGKWVLFCSVQTGHHELYAQRFTGPGSGAQDAAAGRVQISTNGHDGVGWWSPDGKEIRYVDGDKQVVSVQVQTEPKFTTSLPKVLYSLKDLKTRSLTWAPDGRVLAVMQGENERVSRIDLIVNAMDEVRAKLSATK